MQRHFPWLGGLLAMMVTGAALGQQVDITKDGVVVRDGGKRTTITNGGVVTSRDSGKTGKGTGQSNAAAGKLGVTVESATTQPKLESFSAGPGMKFLSLRVKLANSQSAPVTVKRDGFHLQADAAASVQADTPHASATAASAEFNPHPAASNGAQSCLKAGAIPAKGNSVCTLVFEVPAKASTGALVYNDVRADVRF